MNSKIAISILLVITSLSVLTVLMLVTNDGFRDKSIVVELSSGENEDGEIKSTNNDEILEKKDYSVYQYPDIERQKDEARARLKKLEELRAGINN